MDLILILGPMKSGKSLELINYFTELKNAGRSFALFQSAKNVRDEKIRSRNGAEMEGKKVHSLKEALGKNYYAVGIDEIHMFPGNEADTIAELLKQGTRVVASGLHMDYRGKIFAIIKRLLALEPTEVRYKKIPCEICKRPDAVYSQVFLNGKAITGGLPTSIPDDGTYDYVSVCRQCFVKD